MHSSFKYKKIGVFCGATLGNQSIYKEAAIQFAEALVEAQMTLVYGGGNIGLMGVLADHVLKLGGEVIGVIPEFLEKKEIAHTEITELHVVSTLHERKNLVYSMADGFVTLPGGLGSLEEFCEIFNWGKMRLHQKPVGLLNTNHFFDSLTQMMDHMVQEGFLKAADREKLIVDTDPKRLLEKLMLPVLETAEAS